MKSIVDILKDRSKNYPDKKIFIFLKNGEDESDSLSYQQLFSKAKRLAATLVKKKLEGKPVVILLPNGLNFIYSFFGCLITKVIAIPSFPPSRGKLMRLTGILENSGAETIISNELIFEKCKRNFPQLMDKSWILLEDLKEAEQERRKTYSP